MANIGLHSLVCSFAVALLFQVSSAGVIRSKELRTLATEVASEPNPTQSPLVTDALTSEDKQTQTTFPPILFRPNPFRSSGDNFGSEDSTTNLSHPIEEIQAEQKFFRAGLTGDVLPGAEPQLGRKLSLAHSSPVDSVSSMVPVAELAHVNSFVSNQSDVDILARGSMAVTSFSPNSSEGKHSPRLQPTTGNGGIGSERTSQSDLGFEGNDTVANRTDAASTQIKEPEDDHVPKTVLKEKSESSVASAQVFPKEPILSDSFIPPTVQILAYAIDELWEKEKHNLSGQKNPLASSEPLNTDDPEEDSSEKSSRPTNYKKKINEIEKNTDDEDDANNRPVFQTNVPVVNAESVPMKMTMDIIPGDLPGEFEDPVIQYPTQMADYDDETSNGSQIEDDTLATGSFNNDLTGLLPAQLSPHPWGKDYDDQSGSTDLSGYPEDIERDVEEHIDLFMRLQDRIRAVKYSVTFASVVKLHSDLAAYVRDHNVKKYKGYSAKVTEVLRETTSGDLAEQLKVVIGSVLEDSQIDDASLEKALKDFFEKLSNPKSEIATTLRRTPALKYV